MPPFAKPVLPAPVPQAQVSLSKEGPRAAREDFVKDCAHVVWSDLAMRAVYQRKSCLNCGGKHST